MSKSEMMRSMWDEGRTIADISKELGCVYSYVYGVIDRYELSKGNDIRGAKKTGSSKADKVRALYEAGMEIGDICREMVKEGVYINYSYCWSIVNKVRKQG